MHRSTDTVQRDFLGSALSDSEIDVSSLNQLERTTSARQRPRPITDTAMSEVTLDAETGTLWVRLKPDAPVKFTTDLLADLRALQEQISGRLRSTEPAGPMPRYQVFSSAVPGVFSLGGDLVLFKDCIKRRDARALRTYARDAVDLVHANAVGYEEPITTISLVQGQALGGGFEAALAAHVVVAERGSRMGLPEVMFNMFPGMGAFQLLARRLSPAQAENLILSGRTYTAEELHEMGVVDVLADDGDGENAVRRYVRTHDRQHHGHTAFRQARQAASPLDRHELYQVADVWVETAMGLDERDLETIDYLLRAQDRMAARASLEATGARLLRKA